MTAPEVELILLLIRCVFPDKKLKNSEEYDQKRLDLIVCKLDIFSPFSWMKLTILLFKEWYNFLTILLIEHEHDLFE